MCWFRNNLWLFQHQYKFIDKLIWHNILTLVIRLDLWSLNLLLFLNFILTDSLSVFSIWMFLWEMVKDILWLTPEAEKKLLVIRLIVFRALFSFRQGRVNCWPECEIWYSIRVLAFIFNRWKSINWGLLFSVWYNRGFFYLIWASVC